MKILIVRFSSIGDIVLTTPVIRCLKKQLPECELHFATKKNYKVLVENNPYIDKYWLLEDSFSTFAKELKKEKFDLIIDLHNNLRSLRIWLNLRCKRIAFDKLNFKKWLYVRFKWQVMPNVHIVDRYLKTVKKLGVENDGKGLDYFIPEQTILPPNLPENYVVYAIGGQHNTKKMPLNKQVELLQKINLPVVLVGGKEDVAQAEQLIAACSNAVNFCGNLSINQSALVIKNAKSVITHDTGMMHIAAALRKKIYSLWGNTTPELGMYPYYPIDYDTSANRIGEVHGLNCRPCSKIGFSKCPKQHFHCMQWQVFDETFF